MSEKGGEAGGGGDGRSPPKPVTPVDRKEKAGVRRPVLVSDQELEKRRQVQPPAPMRRSYAAAAAGKPGWTPPSIYKGKPLKLSDKFSTELRDYFLKNPVSQINESQDPKRGKNSSQGVRATSTGTMFSGGPVCSPGRSKVIRV